MQILTFLLLIGDFFLSFTSLALGEYFWSGSLGAWMDRGGPIIFQASLVAFVLVLTSFSAGLYDSESNASRRNILLRIAFSLVFALLLLSGLYFLVETIRVEKGLLLISLLIFALLQFIWHSRYVSRPLDSSLRRVISNPFDTPTSPPKPKRPW